MKNEVRWGVTGAGEGGEWGLGRVRERDLLGGGLNYCLKKPHRTVQLKSSRGAGGVLKKKRVGNLEPAPSKKIF